jgi:hypothetical protein
VLDPIEDGHDILDTIAIHKDVSKLSHLPDVSLILSLMLLLDPDLLVPAA